MIRLVVEDVPCRFAKGAKGFENKGNVVRFYYFVLMAIISHRDYTIRDLAARLSRIVVQGHGVGHVSPRGGIEIAALRAGVGGV